MENARQTARRLASASDRDILGRIASGRECPLCHAACAVQSWRVGKLDAQNVTYGMTDAKCD